MEDLAGVRAKWWWFPLGLLVGAVGGEAGAWGAGWLLVVPLRLGGDVTMVLLAFSILGFGPAGGAVTGLLITALRSGRLRRRLWPAFWVSLLVGLVVPLVAGLLVA